MSAGVQDRTSVSGPIPGIRISEEVFPQIGRLAYLWAWRMVNMHHRRVAFEKVPKHGAIGGAPK